MILSTNKGGWTIIYKAYKFRLYSNEYQRILMSKTFDSQRFVYNQNGWNSIVNGWEIWYY